jgi:sulfate-transporting ATPase
LFEDLTVRDNLLIASDNHDVWAYARDLLIPRRPRLTDATASAISAFGVQRHLTAMPDKLPYGVRRLVGVVRAVSTMPSVLFLDEPAAGLDDHETTELGVLISRLARQWGIGIVLVEHDVDLVMDTCDRIVVLDAGRQIAAGSPRDIRDSTAVVEAYLGAAELAPEGAP